MSRELNRLVVEGDPCGRGLVPYVFKVGTTRNNCRDRWRSLTQFRKGRFVAGCEVFDEPAYAGVVDWKFLRCWDTLVSRHDDRVFKPWLRRAPVGDGVSLVEAYTMNAVAGVAPGTTNVDLYMMSEEFARSPCTSSGEGSLHRQMLRVAADAMVLLIASLR